MLEELQGTGKAGDRFGVSRTGCLLSPGARQILYGLARVGGATVMVGQLGQVIVDPILEQRLDRLTRALMQEPAALDQNGVIRVCGELLIFETNQQFATHRFTCFHALNFGLDATGF